MAAHEQTQDLAQWPPGTVRLQTNTSHGPQVALHPIPTTDPNDPLNWSRYRKTLNFSLAMAYVFLTFVQLDVGFTAWQSYERDIPDVDVPALNNVIAVGNAGLAFGCVFFVPLMHKYGRRPVYLVSTLLQFAACIWSGGLHSLGELYGQNLLAGLSGAVSETIAQVTIADLFFVHHHALTNGIYLVAMSAGTYLGPVAAGYIIDAAGWRWMWWIWAICFGVNLVLVVFLFEESKYVPNQQLSIVRTGGTNYPKQQPLRDPVVQLKPYWQRLSLVTPSAGSFWRDVYEPFVILCTIPAATYTALTFGGLLAWFGILTSTQSTYLFLPPYNFTAAGVGLMNLAAFVGSMLAFMVGGYLNDKHIMWLARRNAGIYEPEMRLWQAIPPAIITPAGIFMLGVGMARGLAWPILAVGYGLFGFGFVLAGNVALAYTMDCYHNIVGNALVSVVFMRNALATVTLFVISPWIQRVGLQNMQITTVILCFLFMALPVPLLIWGKRIRVATRVRYERMAIGKPTYRTE